MTHPTEYDNKLLMRFQTLSPELEQRLLALRAQVVELGDAPEAESERRLLQLDLAIADALALLDVIDPEPENKEHEDGAAS